MAKLFSRRTAAIVAVAAASMLVLSACSKSDSGSGDKVAVSLITKDQSNPFFVAMIKGATAKAESLGVELTVSSGKDESDYAGQIAAIENAVSAKHAGILIVPVSTEVNAAITKARDAGLFVIALDTPPDPADIVDITFATDNCEAGRLIGQWTAKKLAGKKATIALLDIFDDRIVSVDYCRDNGFLDGMGIDVKDPKVMGDEAKTGKYSGGDYEIVGNVATGANEDGGRTGLEKLLAKNKKINVVYTINEPTAIGACAAAKAAGVKIDAMVSVDGGGAGIGAVKSGCINATSQQYPLLMADLGVQAIYDIVKNGTKPSNSEGLDFFNTGVKLITDDPQEGVPSETTEYGLANAWG
ncbi:sugar ABC transporter substrate-binding protein [Actinobacteria bacterium IMCC26103]|nr:sugar ABC transporter substrate-binding protein [Actinobacteria bacterium IMCC26103]